MRGLREMKQDWKEVRDNEIPNPEYEKEIKKYGEWERFNDEPGFVILGKDYSESDDSLLKNDKTRMTHPSTRYHPELCDIMSEQGYSKEEIGMMDYLQSLKGRILDKNNLEKNIEEAIKSERNTATTLKDRVSANKPWLNKVTRDVMGDIRKGIHEMYDRQLSKINQDSTKYQGGVKNDK